MKKITFRIYTLGCKVNQTDSYKLSGDLIQAGFELTKKFADVVMINSCAVTQVAMSKSQRMINKARKENPKAKIILMGCWPKIYRKETKKIGADLVWRAGDIMKLLKKVSKYQITNPKQIQNYNFKIQNKLIEENYCKRSRYFLKIQDGCEQFCSYCIVPFSRGKLWSKPITEVIREVEQAMATGYQEIVLCGIHLGLYGQEIKDKKLIIKNNIVLLLSKLIKIKDLGRIRLSSIEITEVDDELIKLMAGSKKICRHLHLPLQSGSDKILKLMSRPYKVKYFENKITRIKKLMPDIALTTDVIVGFPSETDKDFQQTYNFIKKIKFSRLHVFPFSSHEKTAASKMPWQVSEQVKIKRAKILRRLGNILMEEYKNKFKGKELAVVVERINADKFIGKTEYYFDIEFHRRQFISKILNTNSNNYIGRIVRVKNKY